MRMSSTTVIIFLVSRNIFGIWHNFHEDLINRLYVRFANRQTDKQTDRQTTNRGFADPSPELTPSERPHHGVKGPIVS